MGRARRLAVLWSVWIIMVATAAAQGPPAQPPPPSTPEFIALTPGQERELGQWLSAVEEWQQYDATWRNRPARDGWGNIAPRQTPPDPPRWLQAHCTAAAAAEVVGADERTEKACRLLADPRAGTESLPAQAATMQDERPSRSSFWTRVHVDGLWTTSASGRWFYGIIGSHVTLVDIGRLQVFGPPGILLLSVPDGPDSRRITIGYTWGVSVRLTDVRFFAPTKNMTLFLNVSKVWADSGGGEPNLGSLDMIGFSLAPKRKR